MSCCNVARGRLVYFEGFSFAFSDKNEEWRDFQLVFQITFASGETHHIRKSKVNHVNLLTNKHDITYLVG